jgi:hypothetical protein
MAQTRLQKERLWLAIKRIETDKLASKVVKKLLEELSKKLRKEIWEELTHTKLEEIGRGKSKLEKLKLALKLF